MTVLSPLSFLPFTFNSSPPSTITVGATLGSVAFTSVPRLLTSWAFTSCFFPFLSAWKSLLKMLAQVISDIEQMLLSYQCFRSSDPRLTLPYILHNYPLKGKHHMLCLDLFIDLAPPPGCHSRSTGISGLLTIAPQCIVGVPLVLATRKHEPAVKSFYLCKFWSKLNSCMEKSTDLPTVACAFYLFIVHF